MGAYYDETLKRWMPMEGDWDLPEPTYAPAAQQAPIVMPQKAAPVPAPGKSRGFSDTRLELLKRRLAALNRWTPEAP